jgi:hypothetical protein
VQAFEAMHRAKDKLGVDALDSGAVVFGHSEGVPDATLTRARLEEAGFPNAMGKLVSVSGGLAGRELPESFKLALRAFGGALGDGASVQQTLAEFQPEVLAERFPPERQRLVDLSVGSTIGPPPGIGVEWGFPPRITLTGTNNVRPAMRLAARGDAAIEAIEALANPLGGGSIEEIREALTDTDVASDGLVPTAVMKYGKEFAMLAKPYDHAGMIEDPGVVDALVRKLSGVPARGDFQQ